MMMAPCSSTGRRQSVRIAGNKRLKQQREPSRALSRARKPSCKVCSELRRALGLPLNASETIQLGHWLDIISSGCLVHRELFLVLSPGARILQPCGGTYNEEICLQKRWNSPAVHIDFKCGDAYFVSQQALVKVPCIQSNYGHGKTSDQYWIDISLLRQWKSKCDRQHGSECHISQIAGKHSSTRPMLLIDTWRMCLKISCLEDQYVTLSYVWGNSATLKTTKANLDNLLTDQALASTDIASKIPRTIMDAIKLLGLIYERYLWVDCLCIVQDDLDSLQRQLHGMASIYASARLSIIAADGKDATHGLRGIRGISQPRIYSQNSFTLSKGHKCITVPQHGIHSSVWNTRGWTFQEEIYSKRRLVFCDSMIRWECPTCTWREDCQAQQNVDADDFATYRRRKEQASLSQPCPNLEAYFSLVSKYNIRELRYPGDVLAAFNGLTSSLGESFDSGFLWGLPEMFFDVALLWEMCFTEKRASNNLGDRNIIPSWSWMAWKGYISDNWNNGMSYVLGAFTNPPANFDTVPILQWYSVESPGGKRRAILSTWRKYRHIEKNETLPHGWTRNDNGGQITYFTHKSDPSTKFAYPIPIKEQPTRPILGDPENFIACRTQKASFSYATSAAHDVRKLQERTHDGDANTTKYSILGKQDEWVGCLHLDEDVMDRYAEPGACDLIAISAGYEGNWEARVRQQGIVDENLRSRTSFEYFNVLYIEWKDGIAYRKGIGKVLKDKWEKQELEWIDVTLG